MADGRVKKMKLGELDLPEVESSEAILVDMSEVNNDIAKILSDFGVTFSHGKSPSNLVDTLNELIRSVLQAQIEQMGFDKNIVQNPEDLKKNILNSIDALLDPEENISTNDAVKLIIRAVAEQIHSDMIQLTKEYSTSLAFEATMDQVLHIKYGSEYQEK